MRAISGRREFGPSHWLVEGRTSSDDEDVAPTKQDQRKTATASGRRQGRVEGGCRRRTIEEERRPSLTNSQLDAEDVGIEEKNPKPEARGARSSLGGQRRRLAKRKGAKMRTGKD
ncbi:hypothetical protein B0H19DRAFT_1231840 [Mycena capillaripes]|nr:hypothetical protein B0H19DRAFT_1231840 [Mycena capillaripes]